MLFICGTPLGNLEDISIRTLRILREADCIAAEDTRHTLKLLNHFEIKTPLVSYHEHNKKEKGQDLLRQLKEGRNIAIVTDAGMPGISDPGRELICLCHENGIAVTSSPGPTAAVTALVLSGMDSGRFCFEGFLPVKNKERQELLKTLTYESRTIILYEAPHRLIETLEDLFHALGDRRMTLARELTKVHEEIRAGSITEVMDYYRENTPKGEMVLIIEGCGSLSNGLVKLSLAEHMEYYLNLGMSQKEAMKMVAGDRGVSKSEIYGQLMKK